MRRQRQPVQLGGQASLGHRGDRGRAMRSTSQARPDSNTPAPISTGTNTFICSGFDSQAKVLRGGGAEVRIRSSRTTRGSGGESTASRRSLTTLSRCASSEPMTATSAAMKMAADMRARFHSHR